MNYNGRQPTGGVAGGGGTRRSAGSSYNRQPSVSTTRRSNYGRLTSTRRTTVARAPPPVIKRNISPTSYIHISGIALTVPVTASIPREAMKSMHTTALRTGKPEGFWYASGSVWQEKAQELYSGRTLYYYELPAELFTDKSRKGFMVSAKTMPAIYEGFSSWLRRKYRSIVDNLLYKIIEDRDPDDALQLHDLFSLFSNSVPEYDEDEPDDFYEWADRIGSKLLATNFPMLEELPQPFNTERSYAYAWSLFWLDVVAKKHAYIYFDASILTMQDTYPHAPWIKFLDIPSGCIFDAAKFFTEDKQPRLM